MVSQPVTGKSACLKTVMLFSAARINEMHVAEYSADINGHFDVSMLKARLSREFRR